MRDRRHLELIAGISGVAAVVLNELGLWSAVARWIGEYMVRAFTDH